ncbi:elongation of very long chain fatty acids protein AAEL008004 isoform X5 [Cephus cinctus]|uniref:Elongation of very long chain fatty acids protein n=1 Tax=Cephus cinctus TaxID=211228 RepID=A0AAJ7W700_CEPCN|nr:elongation of very long chain fatty acids protein AAEL008004 isoform X5 [Cephus cinctus]
MSIIMQYVDRFHEMLDKHADSRTTNWFLMSSPFPTLFICLGYVYLVKVLGPKIMENRKPFQLKNVLIAYNLFQVIFSAWLFYEIFFVLRKKNDHVSTLHVIHHGCMPMSVWFGVKFTPGGHSTFFGLLNTFVHIVMYSYYLLAAFGPKMQPYLWWKKYLTAFQMLQFIAIMIHAFQLLFIDCNYPKAFVWWIGMHAVMFFFLFNEFYQQSYAQKNLRRAKAAAAKALANGSAGTGLSNGVANGTTASSKSAVNSSSGNETNLTNGSTSRRRDPADYYIKGESLAASELNLRKPFVSSE